MPLPHYDEICRTDRAGDKWQEGESVCEKCCAGVFGSWVCALVISFFFFLNSKESYFKSDLFRGLFELNLLSDFYFLKPPMIFGHIFSG